MFIFIPARLPPVRGVYVGMTNNQRHPLLFWPSISDQSEPHYRVSRKDSIRTINAFRGSEENLVDKDFTPSKQYTYTESKSLKIILFHRIRFLRHWELWWILLQLQFYACRQSEPFHWAHYVLRGQFWYSHRICIGMVYFASSNTLFQNHSSAKKFCRKYFFITSFV